MPKIYYMRRSENFKDFTYKYVSNMSYFDWTRLENTLWIAQPT